MVVRFLPPSSPDDEQRLGVDREDLAEVIDFRARLQAAPQTHAKPSTARASAIETPASMAEARKRGSSSHYTKTDTAFEEFTSLSEPVQHMPEPGALEEAVRLLARKARSSGELRRELLALEHEANDVDAAILECEDRLYLDDLGLARVVTETLRERKRASRSQIRMKLRERLLPDTVIEEAIGELDDDEEQDLLRAAASERARKLGGLDRQTAERRLLGFLARRGWSGERATRVAREALDRGELRAHSAAAPGRGSLSSGKRSSVRFQ